MLGLVFACLWITLMCWCGWDLARRSRDEIDTLPRWAWWPVIAMPMVGGMLYLLAGRADPDGEGGEGEHGAGHEPSPAGSRRVLGPDDDEEFLSALAARIRMQRAEDDPSV